MRRRLHPIRLATLAICATALTPVAARAQPAPDTTGAASAIALLNQQRAANGIPPITSVDNRYATAWCPDEDTGPNGGEDNRIMSGSYQAEGFTAQSSPWTDAPLHEAMMYYPLVQTAGWAVMTSAPFNGGEMVPYVQCMGLGNFAAEPSTPTAYTFFSEGGPTEVPATITVSNEGPFAPQQLVGIPEGTPTGPQPIFYVLGVGQIKAVSWSLTDATTGAAVPDVSMVDSAAVQAAGYDPQLLWDDAVMVPPALLPGNVYNGRATFAGADGRCVAEAFSFETLQSDGSPLGAQLPSPVVEPCHGGPGGSTPTTATSGSTSHTASADPTTVSAPRVSAVWSRRSGLVIRAALSSGERVAVREGHRFATVRRRRARLRWPYARTVTVWATVASGHRSRKVIIPVTRG